MKERLKLTNGKLVYSVILARSGSKSIKNKNIVKVNNKFLITYAINAALKSKNINRVFVLTDSLHYAKIAKSFGAEIPFIRPKNISGDKSRDIETFKYFINHLKKKNKKIPDCIVHLRATAPLIDSKEIDNAIKFFLKNKNADSLKSITPSKQTPYKMWKIDNKGYLKPLIKINKIKEQWNSPRLLLPKTYFQNAQVDIFNVKLLKNNTISGKKIIPYLIENYVDIDSYYDLIEAEMKLNLKNNKRKFFVNIDRYKKF